MSLTLHAFCSYLTSRDDDSWKQEDRHASKLVKAVKGESVNGYAKIPVNGVLKRLDSETRREALTWVANWAATKLPRNAPCVLIPIPGSSTTSDSTDPCRAWIIAKRIAAVYGAGSSVADVLRFSHCLDKARTGGPRFAEHVYPHLVALPWTPPAIAAHYVLIDDVFTSGGHVRACAAFLLRHFGVNVTIAICAGRTVKQSPDDPFSIAPHEVPSFFPEQYGL